MNKKITNRRQLTKTFLGAFTLILLFSGLYQLSSIQNSVYAASSSVSYTTDDSSFANPERGYISQFGYINDEPHDYTVQELIDFKAQHKISTARFYYFFTNYKNSDIPQSVIDKINEDASKFRQAGMKIMPTVSYSPEGDGDAPLSTILRHIEQLTPYYQNNKDVIAAVYGGYFGNYGEMWGSTNGLVDDQSGGRSINSNTIQIFDKLLAAVPSDRSVLFRYPVFKRQYTNDNNPTSLSQAFQQTNKSRIGYYNDALLSSDADGDTGTYSYDGNKPFAMNIVDNRNYVGADGKYVPNSGESGQFTDYPTQNCAAARVALRNLGQDFIHSRNFITDLYGPNGGVNYPLLATLSAEGCYDEVGKNLGYRLRLVDSTIVNNSVTVNQSAAINLKIVNDGYASPFNPRGLEVVLRNQSTGVNYKVDVLNTTTDPRLWFPQNGEFNLSLNPSLAGIPEGNYSTFLNLPDTDAALKNRPDYSIRLANTNIWEASTGFNNLNQTISITAPVASSSSSLIPSSSSAVPIVSSSSIASSSSSLVPSSSSLISASSSVVSSSSVLPVASSSSSRVASSSATPSFSSLVPVLSSVDSSSTVVSSSIVSSSVAVVSSAPSSLVASASSSKTSSSTSIVTASSSAPQTSSASSNLPAPSSSSRISSAATSSVPSSTTSSSITSSSSTAPNPSKLKVKVNLAGSFNPVTNKMSTTLNSLNLIPRNQPFNNSKFNYTGQEVAIVIPADAVDWILVELKDQNGNIIAKRAGLVDADGNFVDSATLDIGMNLPDSLISGNYSVNVRHLNHVAIGTDTAIFIAPNSTTSIDFTSNANTKSSNQDILSNGKHGMRSGNPNGDNANDSVDRTTIQSSDEINSAYSSLDVNRDGSVDSQDRTIVLNTVEATEATN